MGKDCSMCGYALEGYCVEEELWGGDKVKCPECGEEYIIYEHTDGCINWMTFHKEKQ